jgi:hypothetical protein
MATINWVNSAGGDFGVAANWSTDSVPFLNDDLTVSAFGQYLVTISDNDQANSLTFNAPQAALDENAGSLALTGDAPGQLRFPVAQWKRTGSAQSG